MRGDPCEGSDIVQRSVKIAGREVAVLLTKGSRRASPTTLRRHDELTLPKCFVMWRTWLPWTAAAVAAQHNAPRNPQAQEPQTYCCCGSTQRAHSPDPCCCSTQREQPPDPQARGPLSTPLSLWTKVWPTQPAMTQALLLLFNTTRARHAPDPCCCCCET